MIQWLEMEKCAEERIDHGRIYPFGILGHGMPEIIFTPFFSEMGFPEVTRGVMGKAN